MISAKFVTVDFTVLYSGEDTDAGAVETGMYADVGVNPYANADASFDSVSNNDSDDELWTGLLRAPWMQSAEIAREIFMISVITCRRSLLIL